MEEPLYNLADLELILHDQVSQHTVSPPQDGDAQDAVLQSAEDVLQDVPNLGIGVLVIQVLQD